IGTIPDGAKGEGRPAAVISAKILENSICRKIAGRPFACPQTKNRNRIFLNIRRVYPQRGLTAQSRRSSTKAT
ncbi:hypothetical protein, partial [Mesorhizobium sp. M4B.F.Ca.ET.049.02.1.2]|uniref:hypothetical protein n=1 Tax=Mesorhizobium sp. M4B.F.Ca.ET.049.02.1.2 TaxID=2496752 RepID=UPI001AED0BDA